MRKTILTLAILVGLTGCGYQATDAEMIGQARKVGTANRIFCSDYTYFDITLGVVRNGTGSMSTEDVVFLVSNKEDVAKIRAAVGTGSLVKVNYNVFRAPFCTPTYEMTSFAVIE